MSQGKRGATYGYPNSFVQLLVPVMLKRISIYRIDKPLIEIMLSPEGII
jgi:hypothetical protein